MKRLHLILTLMATLAAGAVHAQMVGNLEYDLAMLDGAFTTALDATREVKQEESRLAMELLYGLWRTFRRMNIEAHADDPQFVSDVEMVEARLWAASQLIDNQKPFEAHDQLDAARIVVLQVRQRYELGRPAESTPQ
jgi:hypothetical protein